MRRILIFTTSTGLIAAMGLASAWASSVDKMTIITAAQTVQVSKCSGVTTVQAQDVNSQPANVPQNTTIYFTGSSSSLTFYSDSACSNMVDTVVMPAGTNKQNFYFKSSATGTKKVIVATYAYNDGYQYETISSTSPSPSPSPSPSKSPSPSPSPTVSSSPTPAPSPSPIPSPSPSPTSAGIAGRAIPAPVYGVTLDDVSNVSGELASFQQLYHMPTARIVFDNTEPASYYLSPIQTFRNNAYIMGQLADSSYMPKFTVSSITTWTQQYTAELGNLVDVWEIGNEVNGDWLGSDVMAKIEAMYDTVSNQNGRTALTFFYEGEPNDPNNCISTLNGGNDMFTWINDNFDLGVPANQRPAETEKIRLGVNYVLISWYPDQCQGENPDWAWVYTQLASIFPNAKVGFGELGTANPQYGSSYEINEIDSYYPMASTTSGLPASYIGGYFWWYYAEEMVPYTTTLFSTLNNAIK